MRIGQTGAVVAAEHFFSERLAGSLASADRVCPILYIKGIAVHEPSKASVHDVHIYGIDERFWQFHGIEDGQAIEDRSALVGDALAKQIGAKPGDALLIRVPSQQEIPSEWLYGRRDSLVRTIRLTCKAILPASRLGEFALRPNQGNAYSLFLPLRQLQKDLKLPSQVNVLLLPHTIRTAGQPLIPDLKKNLSLQDLGLKLRPLPIQNGFSLESNRILIQDSIAQAAVETAREIGAKASPIYAYLANSIRCNNREIPYSVIAAADIGQNALESIHAAGPSADKQSPDSIMLTEWARRDLGAVPGDPIEIDYFVWLNEGKLAARSARFRLSGVLPQNGGADATLAPDIPGVTGARSINEWDPPFPLDLGRIRKEDEQYWDEYKATPKAFISFSKGQDLWQNRFGKLTSVRLTFPDERDPKNAREKFMRSFFNRLNPQQAGFSITPVREQGLAAAEGSTDFGEYFVYFSFFLIAAAILLSSLFFKLTIEQRVREIGTLRAAGFSLKILRRIFLLEGFFLSVLGSVAGLLGSVVYGWLMVFGLRTWWVDAVGTRRLDLHVSWAALIVGAAAGIAVSFATIAWALRNLSRNSPRLSMAGVLESEPNLRRRVRALKAVSAMSLVAGIAVLSASALKGIPQLEGFFGAGMLLLITMLCACALYLRRSHPSPICGTGLSACLRMGIRNAACRPGRSLVCIALIASATFIIVSTEAFRRDKDVSMNAQSGAGGYALIADSAIPILHDLNSLEGRESLGIPEEAPGMDKIKFVSFRERPGDDASCLNLYKPQDPAILGAPLSFIAAARFSFRESLAETPEQKLNPWLLLQSEFEDGAVPAIADANTIQYILHLSLGSELTVRGSDGNAVRLRLVAALRDSVFQGKIIISEPNLLQVFPEQQGRRFFLLDAPLDQTPSLIKLLRETLADWGFRIELSSERLSAYHRVENAYLSTFQSLGALGLILGTLGLAAVLLRNVLERRREIALLKAVGYRRSVLAAIILAENALLILAGLASGAVCALIATTPALLARGGDFPILLIGQMLLAVLTTGLLASFVAVIAAFRSPLISALHSE